MVPPGKPMVGLRSTSIPLTSPFWSLTYIFKLGQELRFLDDFGGSARISELGASLISISSETMFSLDRVPDETEETELSETMRKQQPTHLYLVLLCSLDTLSSPFGLCVPPPPQRSYRRSDVDRQNSSVLF